MNDLMKMKIISVLQKVFEIEQIDENTSQQDVEKWDSLGHLNLVVALEEEFDVLFEPEEIAEMTSAQKIISKIETFRQAWRT
jgi:acyl carrier protein